MNLPEGVARTSGGRYDPDAGLLYYVAGGPDRLSRCDHPNVLCAVNEVESRKALDLLDRLCDTRNVLLDSGIFNLAMDHARRHKVSHDAALSLAPEEIDGFDSLYEHYCQVATRFADRLWGVIELDQGGVANKPRTRARIEADTGFVPMPVYHPLLDGWDYYDDLARAYDRICFGNLVKAAPPVRLRLIWTASERARAYPYLWTHLLGVYPNQNLLGMPFRGSLDSSSWVTSLRWMPSWKAWSMLKMESSYAPELWAAKADHHDKDGWGAASERAEGITRATALATQRTLDELGSDTHPWLALA